MRIVAMRICRLISPAASHKVTTMVPAGEDVVEQQPAADPQREVHRGSTLGEPDENAATIIKRPMVRARGMPRYYAIAIGRRPGIYVSWEAASRQVTGFRNNRHEMFKLRAEAEQYLRRELNAGLMSTENRERLRQAVTW